MSALIWLLHCAAFYAEKVKETLEQAAAESQLKMCLERLEKMLGSTKNRALIHIAKLEETCTSLPPGSCHLPFPLPSSCRIVPAPPSPVAVTVSSLAPCHPLPPPLLAALGRGAELMPRLRELFPGARRVLSSASPPGTAPRLLSVPVPGQEAVPGSCWPARSPPPSSPGVQRCADCSPLCVRAGLLAPRPVPVPLRPMPALPPQPRGAAWSSPSSSWGRA